MYQINPEILEAEVEGQQMLMLDPERGEYFELNPTSVFIYSMIKKGCDFDYIIKKMLENYDCDQSTAEKDLKELIQTFRDSHILI